MEQKAQWALAYDKGGFRFGIMTTNSLESINRVFIGVRSLPISRIVEFFFHKCIISGGSTTFLVASEEKGGM